MIDEEDPVYLDAACETAHAGGFQVVVYGHTHLPKKKDLELPSGRKVRYLNTGTWCDVMKLPSPVVVEDFAKARGPLTGFLQALKDNAFDPFVARFLTFVEAKIDGGAAEAELYSYCGVGRERSRPLTSARGS